MHTRSNPQACGLKRVRIHHRDTETQRGTEEAALWSAAAESTRRRSPRETSAAAFHRVIRKRQLGFREGSTRRERSAAALHIESSPSPSMPLYYEPRVSS